MPAVGSQTNAKRLAATPAGRSLLDDGNRLKLGLFGFNCSNGLSLTSAETSFDASWDQTLADRAAGRRDRHGDAHSDRLPRFDAVHSAKYRIQFQNRVGRMSFVA